LTLDAFDLAPQFAVALQHFLTARHEFDFADARPVNGRRIHFVLARVRRITFTCNGNKNASLLKNSLISASVLSCA